MQTSCNVGIWISSMFFLINKMLNIVKESIYPSSVEIQIRGVVVFP